jgi:hypothetical protein
MNRINSLNIFLIDGLGALMTASILSLAIVNFQGLLGMPQDVLFFLMIIACVFSFYSLACHIIKPANWRAFLAFIAISNLIYCFVSVGFAVHFTEQLTLLGITYFGVEVLVIILLAFVELRIAFSRIDA